MTRLELPTVSNLIGGLHSNGSLHLPTTDATVAHNVECSPDGVRKRKGTLSLLREASLAELPSHYFLSNGNVPFLLVVAGTALRLYTINEDESELTLLKTYSNVFARTPQDVSFVTLPGEDRFSVLVLSPATPPVQVMFYEWMMAGNATTTVASRELHKFGETDHVNKYTNSLVFADKVLAPAAIMTRGAVSTTVNQASLLTAKVVTVLLPVVSWWAESEFWYGDNFLTQVPRFNVTPADATVKVPFSVLADKQLIGDVRQYTPIFQLFARTAPLHNNFTVPNNIDYSTVAFPVTPTPLDYLTYVHSNGNVTEQLRNYKNVTTDRDVQYGQTHITFGRSRPYVRYTLDSLDNLNDGAAIIPGHQFETGDMVVFPVCRGDGVSTVSSQMTPRYVKKIDSRRVEFYTNASLTARDTTTLAKQTTVGATAVSAPGASQIIAIAANFPTGTKLVHYGDSFSSAGFPGYTNFYVQNLGFASGVSYNYAVYYDPALTTRVTNFANPLVGTGGTWQMRNEYVVERHVLDAVWFARQRCTSFNNYTGSAPVNTRVRHLSGTLAANYNNFVVNEVVDGRNDAFSTWYPIPLSSAQGANSTTNAPLVYVNPIPSLGDNDRITLTNIEKRFIGSAFTDNVFSIDPAKDTLANIHLVAYPVYGLGRFANYYSGSFPSFGAVYNGRLLLSGIANRPNVILFSGVRDYAAKEGYNFFQITDALDFSDPAIPFDVTLADEKNSSLTALTVWQDQLFAFTEDACYRIQAPTPNERVVALLARNGAINQWSTVTSERLLYYISRNGLFAIPLTQSGDYRSGEVSVKVARNLVSSISKASRTQLCYNNDDNNVYLVTGNYIWVYNTQYDNWSTWESTMPFGTKYLTTLKRNVLVNSVNQLGASLLRMNWETYADYVTYGSASSVSGIAPLTTLTFDSSQPFYVTPHRTSSMLSLEDLHVWIKPPTGNHVKLTFGTQWRKSTANEIELLDSTLIGTHLVIAPKGYAGDWFGLATLVNGYQQDVGFGTINPATPNASYTANFSASVLAQILAGNGVGIGAGQTINNFASGYIYNTEWVSGAYGAEVWDVYKRCESVSALVKADQSRYYSGSFVPQFGYGRYVNFSASAKMGVIVAGERGNNSDWLLEQTDMFYADDYVLFRYRPNLLGTMFRFAAYSADANYFHLASFGLDLDMRSGTGQISGGR